MKIRITVVKIEMLEKIEREKLVGRIENVVTVTGETWIDMRLINVKMIGEIMTGVIFETVETEGVGPAAGVQALDVVVKCKHIFLFGRKTKMYMTLLTQVHAVIVWKLTIGHK